MAATATMGITELEGQLPELRAQPTPRTAKPAGRDWFESIGSPKYVVAPMVDQSELAWRILSRLHGATLAYTPMFHAVLFSSDDHTKYADEMFDTSATSLEGVAPYDRPLIVQFCANDKDAWLKAAEKVVGRCDAVDLNLGCPQGIAKKGRYGAFLMEDWPLIGSMISHLHQNLAIPVTAKLRIFPSLAQTLEYASHVYNSGAQLVTVHGRTREAKGALAGLASWERIKAVADFIRPRVPMYANGGLPSAEEVLPCMAETGVDGVMSAEGNLYNPLIFRPANATGAKEYRAKLPEDMQAALDACEQRLDAQKWDEQSAYAPCTYIAAQYLAIVRTLPSTQTALSAVKAHLFKLYRPVFAAGKHIQIREKLAAGAVGPGWKEAVAQYGELNDEMEALLKADAASGALPSSSFRPLTHARVLANFGGTIPYSHAQPYLRVSSNPTVQKTELDLATARPAEDSAEGSPAHKRPRLDTLAAVEDLPPVERMEFVACPGTSHDDPGAKACMNSAAKRCHFGVCKTCCPVMSERTGTECEHHAEKERKEKERNEEKRRRAAERQKNKAAAKAAQLAKKAKKQPLASEGEAITS